MNFDCICEWARMTKALYCVIGNVIACSRFSLSHTHTHTNPCTYTIHRCILNCIVCTLFYIYCKQMPKHQFIQTLQMMCNLSFGFICMYIMRFHNALASVLANIHPHSKSSICGLNAIKFLCIHVNYIHNQSANICQKQRERERESMHIPYTT